MIFRRDAWAFVRNSNHRASAFGVVSRADPQSPPLVHGLDSIVKQIDEHPPQLFAIKVDGRQRVIQLDDELDIFLRLTIQRHDIAKHVVQRLPSHLWRGETGEF